MPPVFLTENETKPRLALSGLGRTLNSLSCTLTNVFEGAAPIGLATMTAAATATKGRTSLGLGTNPS